MDKLTQLRSVLIELASISSQSAAYESWDDKFSRKEVREVWLNLDAPLRKKRDISFTLVDLKNIELSELMRLGFAQWSGDLLLIPLWIFNYISDGSRLTSISGETAIKGIDKIDFDVRGGCLAYGFHYYEV